MNPGLLAALDQAAARVRDHLAEHGTSAGEPIGVELLRFLDSVNELYAALEAKGSG